MNKLDRLNHVRMRISLIIYELLYLVSSMTCYISDA